MAKWGWGLHEAGVKLAATLSPVTGGGTGPRPTNLARPPFHHLAAMTVGVATMTHSFPLSRLAEIEQAAPVEPVSFPTVVEVAVLRRTLKRIGEALASPGLGGGEPAAGPRKRKRTR